MPLRADCITFIADQHSQSLLLSSGLLKGQINDYSIHVSDTLVIQLSQDASDTSFKILAYVMLPDTNNLPAHAAKLCVVSSIAGSVHLDLGLPELGLSILPLREPVPVPEVAVDEDCKPLSREDNIGTSWEIAHVLAEPQTARVKS